MAENKKAELIVTGMACAGCSGAVEKSLRSLDGVSNARVDLAKKMAFVEFNPDKLGIEDMKKAVLGVGYKVAEGKIV
jgi:copper chaperone CopZ